MPATRDSTASLGSLSSSSATFCTDCTSSSTKRSDSDKLSHFCGSECPSLLIMKGHTSSHRPTSGHRLEKLKYQPPVPIYYRMQLSNLGQRCTASLTLCLCRTDILISGAWRLPLPAMPASAAAAAAAAAAARARMPRRCIAWTTLARIAWPCLLAGPIGVQMRCYRCANVEFA